MVSLKFYYIWYFVFENINLENYFIGKMLIFIMGRIEKYVSWLFFFGWVLKGIRLNFFIFVLEINNIGGG